MAAVFEPGANLAAKLVWLGMLGMLVVGVGWWLLWPRTDYARSLGWAIEQPVPFSHQHHVAGLGISCQFCHAAVEVSSKAPMPPTYSCMTCHSQIWTGADVLAPVRDSLARGQPIAWSKVTNVPDYVYFNHSIHIAKGVGCESCHGHVDRMTLTQKTRSFTMQFCLDCHRNPGPNLRPQSEIFDTEWHRTIVTPSATVLMAQYHIGARNLTDCSICHR
jgi:Cytochrome c7 and related cytochrome c